MFRSYSVSCTLLKYLRKAFIYCWLLGVLSCKDFKNWESKYLSKIKITFEAKKDQRVPKALEDLGSTKLDNLFFIKRPIVTDRDTNFSLANDLCIQLNPDAHTVNFELENNHYYQKVVIHYKRVRSLISHKAGGLQIQYTIKAIQLIPKDNKKAIVKEYTIEHPTPLKENKDKTHVTLYY